MYDQQKIKIFQNLLATVSFDIGFTFSPIIKQNNLREALDIIFDIIFPRVNNKKIPRINFRSL